jgi:transcriptional regulator with XRE-family HTH domain
MMGIIDDLRQLLAASGCSANELGRRSGVSPSQVSRYLRGERTLSMPVVEKICDGLGYLLVRYDDNRLITAPNEPTDTERLQERLDQAVAEIERYRRRERETLVLATRVVRHLEP